MTALDGWLRENWSWFAGGGAALWAAYQWIIVERRRTDAAEAAENNALARREGEVSEKLWSRLSTYVDDMEAVTKALRAENSALHQEVAAHRSMRHDEAETYRARIVQLEDIVSDLRREVATLRHDLALWRAARGGDAVEEEIARYLIGHRRPVS